METSAMLEKNLSKGDLRIVQAMIIGISLPLLDTTVMNVAIHTLCIRFATSLTYIQWVTTAYILATVSIIPICGWASNYFGAKRLWICGLGLFFIGSLFSSAAWNLGSLIIFRTIQGLGAGILMPTMQTILAINITESKVRLAFTATAIPSVIAPIIGPLVGGLLLQWMNWRWLFLINLPISLWAFHLAMKTLPNETAYNYYHLDILGIFLLIPGLAALFMGLTIITNGNRPDYGYGIPSLATGIVLILIFIAHAFKSKKTPLINMNIFKIRAFNAVSAVLFLSSVAFYGGLFILPLYFFHICQFNPLTIGMLLGVQGVGALAARSRLNWLSTKLGDREIAFLSLSAASIGTIYFSWSQAPTYPIISILAMLIRGAGLGLLTLLAMSAVYQGLTKEQIAHASIASRIVTQLGASVGGTGIALLIEVLLHSLASAPIQSSYALAFLGLSVITLAASIPGSMMASRPFRE